MKNEEKKIQADYSLVYGLLFVRRRRECS